MLQTEDTPLTSRGSPRFLTPRISLPPPLAKIKCGLFTQERAVTEMPHFMNLNVRTKCAKILAWHFARFR